jgi:hypothetical protein
MERLVDDGGVDNILKASTSRRLDSSRDGSRFFHNSRAPGEGTTAFQKMAVLQNAFLRRNKNSRPHSFNTHTIPVR